MKDIFEPIGSIVWNLGVDLCLWFQNGLTSTWLIIGSVITFIIAIWIADNIVKMPNSDFSLLCVFTIIGCLFMTLTSVAAMSFGSFSHYDSIEYPTAALIIISITITLMLLLIILGFFSGNSILSVLWVCCCIVLGALLSKFIAIIIIFAIITVGGGGTYMGTFIDRYGNKYDVYKSD